MKKEQMKNGRVYIFPLITFVGYLPGENKNICRYLPFFVNTRKTLLSGFSSYSVD